MQNQTTRHCGFRSFSIKKIEQIQIKNTYNKRIRRRQVQHENKGIINRKRLFHGTTAKNIELILENGFDIRKAR